MKNSLVFLTVLVLFSGCVSLKAGYVTKTPKETTERVVGVDTNKIFQSEYKTGSIST